MSKIWSSFVVCSCFHLLENIKYMLFEEHNAKLECVTIGAISMLRLETFSLCFQVINLLLGRRQHVV
jgi:hypothetical protein